MLYRSGLVWGVLCLVLSMASAAAAAPLPEYYAVDLGPLPGSGNGRENVSGWTVNNLGQVAGYGSQYSATLPIDPPLQLGFVWSNGTWSDVQ